ncbi:MAG: protein tyrosine phosphatase family protein [Verrucomicrobiota bacterium]
MDDRNLTAIRNFRRIDDRIATGGQPTEAQLLVLAAAGFQSVINLALTTSTDALADEPASVRALGLAPLHIPVDFEAPNTEDHARFAAAMRAWRGRSVFVHCAANHRVSVFFAILRVTMLGWRREAALAAVRDVWEPDAVWTANFDARCGAGPGA